MKQQDQQQQDQSIFKYKKPVDNDFRCRFQLPPKNLFGPINPSYGQGLGIYYDLLYNYFQVFILLSIITIAQWYLNIKGTGLYQRNKFLTTTWSIANQPLNLEAGSEDEDYQLIMSIYFICDFIYSIVIFVYFYFSRARSYKKLYKVKQNSNSIKDYTVEVSGFPENIKNAIDIKFHFEQLGFYKFQVSECVLQRNYENVLLLQKQKQRVQRLLEIQLNRSDILQDITQQDKEIRKQKLEQLKQQLEEIEKNIDQQIKSKMGQLEIKTTKAFVSFQTRGQRDKAVLLYKQNPILSLIQQQSPDLQFQQQYPLQVIKAQDPQSYMWENQDSNPTTGKIITFCVGLALGIPIILSIFLYHAYYYWIIDKFSCLTKDFAITSNQYKECYCIYDLNPKQIKNIYCDKNYYDYYWIATHGNSSFALIVNILMYLTRVSLEYFVQQERNGTKFIQNRRTFTMIFLWLFLNGIFFIFFLNIYLDEQVSFSKYVSYIFGSLSVEEDNMISKLPKDVGRNWTMNVGQKFIYIAKFNVVFPYIASGLYLIFQQFTNFDAQEKIKVDKIIDDLQIQIRKDDPEINHNYYFTMGQRYALFGIVIYMGLIFSGPLPFLVLIAAGEIGTILLYDRIVLGKYNCVNIMEYQRLEEEYVKLGIYFQKFLPISVLLHLCVSIYCYSSYEVFPNIQAVGYIKDETLGDLPFYQRLSKSLILTLLFFIFLLFYILVDILGFNKFLKDGQLVKEIDIIEGKVPDEKSIDQKKLRPSITFEQNYDIAKSQSRLFTYDISVNVNYSYIVDSINAQTGKQVEQFRYLKSTLGSTQVEQGRQEKNNQEKQNQSISQVANQYNLNNFSFITPNNMSILSPVNPQRVELRVEDDKIIEKEEKENKTLDEFDDQKSKQISNIQSVRQNQ